MRSLALALLLVISVAALAFAQTDSNHDSQSQDRSVVTTVHHRHFRGEQPRYEDESDGVCYTMRTYYFERQDGDAPVPSGMTTCTRISQRDLKRADRVHVPQLIPAAR